MIRFKELLLKESIVNAKQESLNELFFSSKSEPSKKVISSNIPNVWYHSTSSKNAKIIVQNGFSLDTQETLGSVNMYGKALWFANPPHNMFKGAKQGLIEITLNSALKIADLRDDKNFDSMSKKLLTIPEVQQDAMKYAQDHGISPAQIKLSIKNGHAHFDWDLWKFGLLHLGYDGLTTYVNEAFYKGIWLGVYNMEKLNSLPRKSIRASEIQ